METGLSHDSNSGWQLVDLMDNSHVQSVMGMREGFVCL